MLFTNCKHCKGEHYHEILEEIITENNILIEARCKNCFAVTTTRYKTEILYGKTLLQSQYLFENTKPTDQ